MQSWTIGAQRPVALVPTTLAFQFAVSLNLKPTSSATVFVLFQLLS